VSTQPSLSLLTAIASTIYREAQDLASSHFLTLTLIQCFVRPGAVLYLFDTDVLSHAEPESAEHFRFFAAQM